MAGQAGFNTGDGVYGNRQGLIDYWRDINVTSTERHIEDIVFMRMTIEPAKADRVGRKVDDFHPDDHVEHDERFPLQ